MLDQFGDVDPGEASVGWPAEPRAIKGSYGRRSAAVRAGRRKPGTGWHYKGVRGKTPQTDNEIVTHRTKRILGIRATVVRDTVSDPSGPVERTFDYYAQDRYGNVWYIGALSLEKRHGHFVRASDSWFSGKDGGRPGIIMPANPRPGERYRQEYYPPGKALDEATVLSRHGSAR